ncbi:PUA-like domain-containing protein [Mycena crocata]|nr:PUA-like domain-containing protein [Mycena crocata]
MSAVRKKFVRSPDVNPKVYGDIPGVPVLSTFANRKELSMRGVHAPPQSGIHGSIYHSAYSIVMAGRYEDDADHGEKFIYTGEGGRDNRKSHLGPQCKDQTLSRGNRGLEWSRQTGKPVRVVRGHTLNSRWAPAEGFRYDGLYKVTESSFSVGNSGFMTYKFTLERLPGQLPLPNEESKTRKSGGSLGTILKKCDVLSTRWTC